MNNLVCNECESVIYGNVELDGIVYCTEQYCVNNNAKKPVKKKGDEMSWSDLRSKHDRYE